MAAAAEQSSPSLTHAQLRRHPLRTAFWLWLVVTVFLLKAATPLLALAAQLARSARQLGHRGGPGAGRAVGHRPDQGQDTPKPAKSLRSTVLPGSLPLGWQAVWVAVHTNAPGVPDIALQITPPTGTDGVWRIENFDRSQPTLRFTRVLGAYSSQVLFASGWALPVFGLSLLLLCGLEGLRLWVQAGDSVRAG